MSAYQPSDLDIRQDLIRRLQRAELLVANPSAVRLALDWQNAEVFSITFVRNHDHAGIIDTTAEIVETVPLISEEESTIGSL